MRSRAWFALGLIGLGVLSLIYGDFALQWQPVPASVPGRMYLAYASGVVMIAAGAGLLSKRTSRISSGVLLVYPVLWLLLKLPALVMAPQLEYNWLGFGEIAVIVAAGLVLFASDHERLGSASLRIALLASVMVAQACASPQSSRVAPAPATATATTIVVVRHAEKSTDDPRDPTLSAAGQQRAKDLSGVLQNAGVTDVYVTQYKRTRQTAEPLARQNGISIIERPVNNDNSATYAQSLAQEILTRSVGKGVLVVGHSNTVPGIVAALSGTTVPPITDAEYDHLFVVIVPAMGAPRLMQLRFGLAAP